MAVCVTLGVTIIHTMTQDELREVRAQHAQRERDMDRKLHVAHDVARQVKEDYILRFAEAVQVPAQDWLEVRTAILGLQTSRSSVEVRCWSPARQARMGLRYCWLTGCHVCVCAVFPQFTTTVRKTGA